MADVEAPPQGQQVLPELAHGDCVFDCDHPWDHVRGGIIGDRQGVLRIWLPGRTAEELLGPGLDVPVSEYSGQIKINALIGNLGGRRLPFDRRPYFAIKSATLDVLRDADGRRLPLDELTSRLKENSGLAHDLIEDALRMMIAEGSGGATINKGGVVLYSLSSMVSEHFSRIDYLATFAEELLIKSRRVDLLIQHTGTVGSYREEMLRALLRQIVPRRYEVSTGFIEYCPRQLDILVWDAAEFVPLFREGDVVVVPRAAVRGVIEVKTTLNTNALDEAMEILWDTFRTSQTAVPVFKGIFAYEADYASDAAVADRMRHFYRSTDPDKIREREHWYMYAGVNMVCVPRKLFVRETYKIPEDESLFPQPVLSGVVSNWPGDTKTAFFLGGLLSHLDLSSMAKSDAIRLFNPLLNTMDLNDLGPIYENPWRPRSGLPGMEALFDPDGARTYVQRVQDFRQGKIGKDDITNGLSRQLNRTPPLNDEPAGSGSKGATSDGAPAEGPPPENEP
ncbi:hypothetical protein NKI32_31395 [Mesorhizobium sp. M0761]|uniref:DUF6602 domain-containing protein n=1 Tax=Mesorhizobium sp. M0761 TaxID=2956994 RepID=UPI003339E5C2